MRQKSTVGDSGARAGSFVRGIAKFNFGVRLLISEEQLRGSMGAIQGDFVIVDVGDNPHSDVLLPLLNKTTNADEVVKRQRNGGSSCVSIAIVHHLICDH